MNDFAFMHLRPDSLKLRDAPLKLEEQKQEHIIIPLLSYFTQIPLYIFCFRKSMSFE